MDRHTIEMPSVLQSEEYEPVAVECDADLKLTADDDVWMVQCPITLDPKTLIDRILLTGSSHFTFEVEEGCKYAVTTHESRTSPVTCVMPGGLQPNILQPAGFMLIKEHFEVPEVRFVCTDNRRDRPEPSRNRHPLLGRDYEHELEIRQRRHSSVDAAYNKETKSKKKERRKSKCDAESAHGNFLSEEAEGDKKEKVKKRRSDSLVESRSMEVDADDKSDIENTSISNQFSDDFNSKKKKKKDKHQTSIGMDEGDFLSSPDDETKKVNIADGGDHKSKAYSTSKNTQLSDEGSPKKKNKKKKKDKHQTSIGMDESDFLSSPDDETKKVNIADGGDHESKAYNTSKNSQLSDEGSPKKKKKKKKDKHHDVD